MDYQEPFYPQEPPTLPPPKRRLRLLPLLLALTCLVTLVRILLRDPWDGYRTVDYSQMDYLRPDTEALFAAADGFCREANEGKDYRAALRSYGELNRLYADYISQSTLCYVRYSMDTEDPFYSKEQDFFDQSEALVKQKMDAMYHDLAGCPFEDQLEADCFGEGFFDDYRQEESNYDEALVALLQQEESLMREYSRLMADPTVLYQGKEQDYRRLLATLSPQQIPAVVDSFYESYNPLAADLFCRLIRVRRDIAEALGYESYAHYAYATLSRSFDPEEGLRYCQSVDQQLLPLLTAWDEQGVMDRYVPVFTMDETQLWDFFSAAVMYLGPEVKEAFRFMQSFSLCRLNGGENRIPGSYTTYLYNYDAPLIVAEQGHTSDDLTTVAHEFGHFYEYYVNFGAPTGIDVSECASQGMELLILSHLEGGMAEEDARYLETARLLSSLEVIASQAGYHRFELEAYALPEEELTPEGLNRLAQQYLGASALAYPGAEENACLSWIWINHFFSAPFYTISYSLSADVALQLYQLEQEGGADEPLYALVSGEERFDLSQAATDAGLEDPLSEARIPALRRLFEAMFS